LSPLCHDDDIPFIIIFFTPPFEEVTTHIIGTTTLSINKPKIKTNLLLTHKKQIVHLISPCNWDNPKFSTNILWSFCHPQSCYLSAVTNRG